MDLKELLPAIDKAVDVAIAAKKDYDSILTSTQMAIDKAQANLNAVVDNANQKVVAASKVLEDANASARQLQEELQVKTTSFLSINGNVKVTG